MIQRSRTHYELQMRTLKEARDKAQMAARKAE